MPGTRGRKDPSLLAPARQRSAPNVIYVVNGRALKVGHYEVPDGVEVPGAASWPRVEAWVGARRIRQLASGEKYTTFEDYTTAVDAEKAKVAEALEALQQSLAEEAAAAVLKAEGDEAPASTE